MLCPFWIVRLAQRIVFSTTVFAGVLLAFLLVSQEFPILLALRMFRHRVSHPHDCIRLAYSGMSYTYILPHPGSTCQDTCTYQFGANGASLWNCRACIWCPLQDPLLRAFVRGPFAVTRTSGLRIPLTPQPFPFVIVRVESLTLLRIDSRVILIPDY